MALDIFLATLTALMHHGLRGSASRNWARVGRDFTSSSPLTPRSPAPSSQAPGARAKTMAKPYSGPPKQLDHVLSEVSKVNFGKIKTKEMGIARVFFNKA